MKIRVPLSLSPETEKIQTWEERNWAEAKPQERYNWLNALKRQECDIELVFDSAEAAMLQKAGLFNNEGGYLIPPAQILSVTALPHFDKKKYLSLPDLRSPKIYLVASFKQDFPDRAVGEIWPRRLIDVINRRFPR